MTSSATQLDEATHTSDVHAMTRSARRLGWRLAAVGLGMVMFHFTLVLPVMNGSDVSPISLLLAIVATCFFIVIWNRRGNAVEQLSSFRLDGTLRPLGPARLSNVVANWKSVWPLAALLTAPVTILALIAIIGPP